MSGMEFKFESTLLLEESRSDHVVVEGTLLTEGVSKPPHNKLYTVEDTNFQLVAETAEGQPVYYGIDMLGQHNAPPLEGAWSQQHVDLPTHNEAKPIGKIIKSWFDRAARKVRAKIKIWEPDLMRRVREGFKISVRGLFEDFKNVIINGAKVMKVIGLKIKDIQLLEPSTVAGVSGAKVDKVLSESMEFFYSDETLAEIGLRVQELADNGLLW